MKPDVASAEAIQPLKAREFEAIRKLAYEKFGLDLKRGKEQLVSARLGRKLREQNFPSFEAYFHNVLNDTTGEALAGMIDALTTNHTSFFREPAHFDFLKKNVIDSFRGRPSVSIWSAGCSSGEEPYTISFFLREEAPYLWPGKLRIMATDISTRVLETASRGIYPADRFSDVKPELMRKYLLRGSGQWSEWYRVKPEMQKVIQFGHLNLLGQWPSMDPFTVIFCRNVMIYFDKPTQETVVNRLSERLEPGGYLFVGHSESLTGVKHSLEYVRPAVYRRPLTPVRVGA